MTIDSVLFFDTETTGVPERSAKWDADFEKFPHIVSISWMIGCNSESFIILPEGWEIPQEATNVNGITTEYALENGVPFADVIELFIQDCHEAGLLCAHNIYFDTSIIKANIIRELGMEYYKASGVEEALYKGKRLDTMRSTMKWVDARTAAGRLKFPTLTELYSRCFPGESFPAHDSLEDVKAIVRCLPVLLEKGLLELKVKEYPEPAPDDFKTNLKTPEKAVEIAPHPESTEKAPNFGAKEENDNPVNETAKAPEMAESAKITGVQTELLEQNEF